MPLALHVQFCYRPIGHTLRGEYTYIQNIHGMIGDTAVALGLSGVRTVETDAGGNY